jgi:tRNA G10  N-methylase Trm11
MSFVALVGAHPAISAAELTALGHPVQELQQGKAWLQGEVANPEALMRALGGTHRLCAVIKKMANISEKELIEAITVDLTTRFPEGKLTFSLQGDNGSGVRESASISLKRHLQSLGRSARAFAVRGKFSPAIAVIDNGLLKRGGEYFILKHGSGWALCRTVAIQDIEDWGHRDFGRPRRNAKQGMLPPKLARMMVNLAGDLAGKTLLDPFCGSGTILMEGGERGATQLYGSDIAPLAIADTQANLTWSQQKAELITGDVRQLTNHFPNLQIDAIVTETYLGAPQRGGEQRSALVAELAKIEKLYQEAAPELFNILKENGVLVLCVPEYRLDQERLTIASQEILEGAGFIRQDTRFDPLVYHHEGQFVARRIEVYKK